MKKHEIFFTAAVIFLFAIPTLSFAGVSHGPRETGEAVFDEIFMGAKRFVVSVGSGGCTNNGSFKVDVKKEEGLSEITPHYLLTVMRVKVDECKAIFDDGALIIFDLEKDVGIKGNFTYSLTNHVYSIKGGQQSEGPLSSIFEEYLNIKPKE